MDFQLHSFGHVLGEFISVLFFWTAVPIESGSYQNQAIILAQNAAPHLLPRRRWFRWTGNVLWQGVESHSRGLSHQIAKQFCQSSTWICYSELRVNLTNKTSNQTLWRHKKSSRDIPQFPEILYPPKVGAQCLPTNPNSTHPRSCLQRELHELL